MQAPRALVLGILLVTSSSGCALVGSVKPVDEKSEAYQVDDLTRKGSEWAKLPAQPGGGGDAAETASSDVAYQSQKTASIISLNSACRPSFESEGKDLRSFTNLLFLGISDITHREEKDTQLQGVPALQTTLEGKLNDELMKLRTVVLRRGDCVYDLMYVARPEHFAANEADFAQFIASLKLR